jgi:hypothetical protein
VHDVIAEMYTLGISDTNTESSPNFGWDVLSRTLRIVQLHTISEIMPKPSIVVGESMRTGGMSVSMPVNAVPLAAERTVAHRSDRVCQDHISFMPCS